MSTEVTLDTVCYELITHCPKAALGTDAVTAKWHLLLVPAISFDLSALMLCPIVSLLPFWESGFVPAWLGVCVSGPVSRPRGEDL